MSTGTFATIAILLLLAGFITFIGLFAFAVWWIARTGVKQATNMLGAMSIGAITLLCVFVPAVAIAAPVAFEYVVVRGPLGNYVQKLWTRAFEPTEPGQAPLPTATPIGGFVPTGTPVPTGTLLPAPTVAVFTDVLITFQCTPVAMAPNVTTVTLYQWSPTGTTVSQASTGLMAGGWTKEGWLLGCPPEKGLFFSPNQVDWQGAGIILPPELQPPPATNTPIPTEIGH